VHALAVDPAFKALAAPCLALACDDAADRPAEATSDIYRDRSHAAVRVPLNRPHIPPTERRPQRWAAGRANDVETAQRVVARSRCVRRVGKRRELARSAV